MGRIIAVEYLTLDGVFEDPAWTQPYFDEAVGAYQGEAMQWADALLLGRVTYDGMSQAWPAMGNDPSSGGDIMNSIGKYVPTSTLTDPTWNATFLRGDVVEEVTTLKEGEREPRDLRQRAAHRDAARRRPGRRVPAADRADRARRGAQAVHRQHAVDVHGRTLADRAVAAWCCSTWSRPERCPLRPAARATPTR